MEHARERYIMLEVSSWEASENYLGVALIRSGDTVIVEKSGFAEKICVRQIGWNRELKITRPFLYIIV